MNRLDILNGLVFQKLEIFSKDLLNERIIIQKKIYLLQEMGANLGYRFNWYLKGPYSPSLTTFIYDRLDYLYQSKEELSKYSLNDDINEKISLVNSLSDSKPCDLSLDSWYELLASVKYIYENPFLWELPDVGCNSLTKVIKNEKPKYTEAQCKEAIIKLKEIKMIDPVVS